MPPVSPGLDGQILGVNPDPYCKHCQGTGYRVKKSGKVKRCKCIKEQLKKLKKLYDLSSDSL